jgi:cyanophycinase-like exopeptidase
MSPTGRKIHQLLIEESQFHSPLSLGILTTPSGFEVNAVNGWPERMGDFFRKGLANWHPHIQLIKALHRDGEYSTNNPEVIAKIDMVDYLYCGAGSPGYTIKHLQNTLAWNKVIAANQNGTVLCLCSASATAVGKYTLPVYEIFKVGEDLFWYKGLDLFSAVGLNLTIIPHWNNQEGQDFDTTRCYMGEVRFAKLIQLLPPETVIIGIDQLTAAIFDCRMKHVRIIGLGMVHIIKNNCQISYKAGSIIPFTELRIS